MTGMKDKTSELHYFHIINIHLKFYIELKPSYSQLT